MIPPFSFTPVSVIKPELASEFNLYVIVCQSITGDNLGAYIDKRGGNLTRMPEIPGKYGKKALLYR